MAIISRFHFTVSPFQLYLYIEVMHANTTLIRISLFKSFHYALIEIHLTTDKPSHSARDLAIYQISFSKNSFHFYCLQWRNGKILKNNLINSQRFEMEQVFYTLQKKHLIKIIPFIALCLFTQNLSLFASSKLVLRNL